MDVQSRLEALETVVQQIGEAVLATTETVDRLSNRIDNLVNHVQQQGYQVFALSEDIQSLADVQGETLQRLDRMTDALERLVDAIAQPDSPAN